MIFHHIKNSIMRKNKLIVSVWMRSLKTSIKETKCVFTSGNCSVAGSHLSRTNPNVAVPLLARQSAKKYFAHSGYLSNDTVNVLNASNIAKIQIIGS